MSDAENTMTPPEKRSETRSSMFLAAVMRVGTEQAPVKVRNMSVHGALIETGLKPAQGTTVHLLRGSLLVEGTVVWSSGKHCGLRFSSEVTVRDWLAAPTAVHQKRVDEMVALVKAGKMSPGTDLAASETGLPASRLKEELIDDLDAVLLLLQSLEDDLAASDDTLVRHGLKLQNLDIAMQMLRAVSAELAPDSSGRAVSLAKLADLRVACAKALTT